jgi:hypothetical protein
VTRRLDARDVLDADATTARSFRGRVLGVYRRTGPNPWDDYTLVEEDGGPIEVFAETAVQLENEGAVFRMRRKGEVTVVAWVPGPAEAGDASDLRARFLESCIRHEDPTPDGSLGAWLHGELKPKPEAND